MSGGQQLLRALGITVALALIVAAFYSFHFTWHEEPAPLLRLDTPQASASPADEGLDFSAPGLDGKQIDLSHYRGHPVIVDFWATWCGPCKVEIPWFMEFEQQFKDRGFAVLGVSMDEDGWDAVKPYIEDLKINYRVLLGDEQVSDIYGGLDSLPTTLLIDRQGKIASIHIGLSRGKEEFRNDIDHLLGASAASNGARTSLTAAK